MKIINGKKIAQEIIDELKKRPKPEKIFAAILVGNNQQSKSFLKQKEKIAKELGVDFRIYEFLNPPAGELTNDFLRREIGKIALLKKVGGVIVQLPLPEQINVQYVLNVIPREKDIDVLGERALGAFYVDRNPILPPAVEVIKEIFKRENFVFSDLRIAVIGIGFLIGKPVAVWLMNQKVKELKIFEKGSDLSKLKNYDLVISGTGVAGLIKPEMLKDDASVIDFGYSIDASGKISGDFNAINLKPNTQNLKPNLRYTPTPGGTGQILVAKIFENFYNLNNKI